MDSLKLLLAPDKHQVGKPKRRKVFRAWGHVEPMVRLRSARKTFLRLGFTLIELLVVIAIIAILSVVVILTLNPAALMQQSRDANRVSDMSTLNSAIGVYLSAGGNSIGNSNTVYVSIPDPTATSTAGDQCQGLGLPSLPSTYSYHCAATSTVRNTDSTGWIPINFGNVAIGSSLSQLPIDPTNQSSSRLYYTYTTNGTQFEVTAAMESQKYQVGGSGDVISGDGGTLASVYEKGSKLGLEPLDYGDSSLVGYWPLNEGANSTAYDDSGNNATGTWSGTQAGTSGYYSAGKGGGYLWAGQFDGVSDYVNVIPSSSLNNLNSVITVMFWTKTSYLNNPTSSPSFGYQRFVSKDPDTTAGGWELTINNATNSILLRTDTSAGTNQLLSMNGGVDGLWHCVAMTINNTARSIYLDGVLQVSNSSLLFGGGFSNTSNLVIGNATIGGEFLNGLIDGVRIYNRALTASQITAMYAGGK